MIRQSPDSPRWFTPAPVGPWFGGGEFTLSLIGLLRVLGKGALVAGLYFVADVALNRMGFTDGWTIFWPLNGVTVAMLSALPKSKWPLFLFAVEVGTGAGEWLDANPVRLELWLRVASLLEVCLSAWVLPRFCELKTWLRSRYVVLRFAAALLLGPGASGLLAAVVTRHYQGTGLLAGFNQWAPADMLGIALTAPLTLALLDGELLRQARRRSSVGRILLSLAVAVGVALLIFRVSAYPLLFLLYPVLLFVDSQTSFAGAALATPVTAAIGVYCTVHGWGPFSHWPTVLAIPRDAALQGYLGFHVVALLPLSIALMERERVSLELKEANRQLHRLAWQDTLTGLPNRRALQERLRVEFAGAVRRQGALSVLMLDVDCFKGFNDLYGHLHGDDCLKQVGGRLLSEVRRATDLVARYGGEEFMVLLPETPRSAAYGMAEDLRRAVEDLCVVHEASPFGVVTVSVGCATLQTPGDGTPEALIGRADQALYRAKQEGRNRVRMAELDEEPVGEGELPYAMVR